MKKDWQIKKLKDICDKGSSNVNMKDLDKLDGEFPIYGASGFIKKVNFYHQEKEYIGIIKDGSGIGRTMLLPPKSSVIGTIQYILPKENNSIHFINYALQSLDLAKYKQGAAIPHIYFRDYGETELVVPPLTEQKQIVKILDQKFTQIDALKQNAEANLNNAKALFQSELEKAFSNTEWEKKRLGDCGTFKNGMNFASTESGYSIHSLGVGDFKNLYKIENTESLSEISLNAAPSEEYLLKDGDIVFVRSNGNKELVGRCLLVYPKNIPTTYSGFCIRFRKEFEQLDADFLLHYMKSDKSRKILNGKEGANISNLNQKILGDFEVPLPPLEEQKRIVAHLNSLSEKVHKLEEIYTKQLADCDELKQSFLQKAFAGEL
ncbi:MAG: restriction endonuclease subunit S [Treponema sp.]|nr:restriction endonuclease subunit S [Treponema sp.]